ncbi:MAG: transporter substrate-binding domain-containing protein [Nitrospinae bacterium]|nr:transporter substrate-binding domain-containing protein [Nitrospinota bacterium]
MALCVWRGLRNRLPAGSLLALLLPILSAAIPLPVESSPSAADRAWLMAHPTIRVGAVPDWEPISMRDANGRLSGIAGEYLSILDEALPVSFDLAPEMAWGEALDKVKRKELDLLLLLGKTPEREGYLLFTEALVDLPYVIICRDDARGYGSVKELQGKRVAVRNRFVSHEWLSADFPAIILAPRETTLEALYAVSVGEADAFVGSLADANFTIADLGLTRLRISGAASFTNHLRIGVRNDWPELVTILDKTLAPVSGERRQAIWNKWIHLTLPQADYRIVYAVAGFAAALVVMILVGAGYRLRAARAAVENEVRERTKALADQVETLNHAQRITRLGHWTLNPATGEVVGSDELFRIFGLTRDSGAVASFALRLHPDDREREEGTIRRAVKEGTAWDNLLRLRLDDGRIVWVRAIGIPEKGEDGTVRSFTGTAQEVTEQIGMEDELRLAAMITTNMAEGVVLVRAADATIIYANPTMERLFGYGAGELNGKPVALLNAPGDQGSEAVATGIITALNTQGVWKGEILNRKKGGEPFWCEASVSTFHHRAHGAVWIAIHTDITRRKELDEAQRHLDGARDYFTAVSAHELRTPLSKLQLVRLLLDREREGRAGVTKALEVLDESFARINRIVSLTSLYSELRSPGFRRKHERIDLRGLLGSCLDITGVQAKGAGRSVLVRTDWSGLDEGAAVTGDQELFAQAFDEILSNAIKYSRDGGTVHVEGRTEGERIVVAIRDEGVGLDRENLVRIKQPYVAVGDQLHHHSGVYQYKAAGIGLGLTIATVIFRTVGGELLIDSPGLEAGATVTVTLPRVE